VRAYTSSSWWHAEMYKAELILFPRGKTKFTRPDGSIGKCPGHGIVLIGAGGAACDALKASGLGMVWDRRELERSASCTAKNVALRPHQFRRQRLGGLPASQTGYSARGPRKEG